MDPDAALSDLLAALKTRDTDTAREAFEALAGWIDGGGYLPADLRLPDDL